MGKRTRRSIRGVIVDWRDRARESLLLWPAILIVAAAAVAEVALFIDDSDIALDLLNAGPEGVRATLSAIASSVMAVAGVSFSVTVVVVQLAASQFSPRVIRNFLRSRVIQIVLGLYLGTFIYVLLVLRKVAGSGEDRTAFIPDLAVSGAVVLAVICMVALVVFIDHVAHAIQVPSIIEGITVDTIDAIERVGRWRCASDEEAAVDVDAAAEIVANHSGYLEYIDVTALEELDGVDLVRVLIRTGDYAREGDVIAHAMSARADAVIDDDKRESVAAAFSFLPERSLRQDPAFGLRMIADVALRAISPGINDPTTAVYCINTMGDLLSRAAAHGVDDGLRVLRAEGTRVVAPQSSFRDLMRLAFRQIVHYGCADANVLAAVAAALVAVGKKARARGDASAVAEIAEALLMTAARGLDLEEDRAALAQTLAPVLASAPPTMTAAHVH